MTRVFRRDAEGLPGLRGFFLAWSEINPEKLSQLARRFVEVALAPGPAWISWRRWPSCFPTARRSAAVPPARRSPRSSRS